MTETQPRYGYPQWLVNGWTEAVVSYDPLSGPADMMAGIREAVAKRFRPFGPVDVRLLDVYPNVSKGTIDVKVASKPRGDISVDLVGPGWWSGLV